MSYDVCAARTRKGCFVGSHKCTRRIAHKGNHRCGLRSEGTMAKPRNPATQCNFQWKNRRKP
jgi:hypothetical protein